MGQKGELDDMTVSTNPSHHIHLVSDATGETLESMAKAALVQFEGIEVKKHFWPMIRTPRQMQFILDDIKAHPGLVLYTLVNEEIRDTLVTSCNDIGIPSLSLLQPIVDALGSYLGVEARARPGQQYVMDADYFERIEALQFTMAHDDGQLPDNVDEADIVLVGVSRTSKTPTSIYLANRGYRTANIPFVVGSQLPESLDRAKDCFIVGLTVSNDRLVQIRANRLQSIKDTDNHDYVDPEMVQDEITACRRYCTQRDWQVIDVTRRSVEETAAAIIHLYNRREEFEND